MKKLFSILAVVLLLSSASALASEKVEELQFGWNQATSDLPNLDHWTLKWSDSSASGFVVADQVPYTGGAGPAFTSTHSLTVEGAPGASVTKYFLMTATGKNGNESGPSNVVSWTFVIPYSDVSTPQSLTVEIVVRAAVRAPTPAVVETRRDAPQYQSH